MHLNKKLDPMQKNIQTFNIDSQRFSKTKNENPLTKEKGLPANQCLPICQPWADRLATPISCVRGFSFFLFLNLWASTLNIWIVFCLGSNFLFEFILTGCVKLGWITYNKLSISISSELVSISEFNKIDKFCVVKW